MNSIIIKGRIAHTPEIKKTQSDVSVCSFDVAVDREYGKKGEEKITDWFRCNAWRQHAEFVSKYFGKGQEILVRGEMQSRKYEDKEGNKRTAWEIQVERVEFCGSKSSQSGSDQGGFSEMKSNDEDLPF